MRAAPRPMLGIDLGGTKIEALLLDADGREAWRQRVATPGGDYRATVAAVAALVANARSQMSEMHETHEMHAGFSIGIGTPGIAGIGGLMKNCNSTCLNGRPLQADLQAAVGQPVALANDANCLALSEATDGAGAGADVVFAAILGTGAGAGIAVGGRVLNGPNGLAGEWGHNPLPWAEAGDAVLACYCGRRGCIEGCVSGSGLAAQHAYFNGGALRAEAIVARAASGDAACATSMRRHASQLARGLAAVINLLDPDVIVLGGGLSRLAHLYTEVPPLWSRWVFAAGDGAATLRTRLLPALHGDASGVRGAAWLGRSAA